MNKFLKYSHPAMTNKYDLNELYSLDELQKDGLDLERIKILFSPVDWKFEDLEPKKKFVKVEEVQEIE